MKTLEDIALLEHFSELEDLRTDQGKRHNLQVIIIMAICAYSGLMPTRNGSYAHL
jgi:hypothetical protein